jgi:hypothetical protein
MNKLVTIKAPRTSVSGSVVISAAMAGAGAHAVRRFLNFFAANDPQPQRSRGLFITLLPGRMLILRLARTA